MTLQENARFADVLNHRQSILRVAHLAIEDRFSHGQAPGAWNPHRGFGLTCFRLLANRCGSFLSSRHRRPVICVLLTTPRTNLVIAARRTPIGPGKLMRAGSIEYGTQQAWHNRDQSTCYRIDPDPF
jgi:hypothetical protein